MNTIIRKYDEKDIQVITNLFNEVVLEGTSFLTEKPVTFAQMGYRLKNEEIGTYIAVSNNSVVGCYMIRPNLKGRGNHIGNATYFITKKYRGQGIGYQLGKHSLRKAKEFGFKAMQFNSVVTVNEPSKNLWEKLGFKIVGIIPEGFRILNDKLVDIMILHKKL